MRKTILAVLIMAMMLTGCTSEPFNPTVTQVQEILELNSQDDPLTFIKDAENAGLTFEIIENHLDTSAAGEYDIKYRISSGKKSTERTFTFIVKDDVAPVITCPDSIDIKYGNPFIFLDYASAVDERDGDVTNSMHYTGTINTYKVGTYPIVVIAEDRFGNTASKEVTVNVVKDSGNSFKQSICGTYRDVTYTSGQAPTLTLEEDGTYSLFLNKCSYSDMITGKYLQYEDTLYLTCDDFDFSNVPEENLIRFIVDIDGTLVFDSTLTTICAPNYCDVFEKQK